MKIVKFISLLGVTLLMSSCLKTQLVEDSRYFNTENDWIYDVMSKNYLFRDGMTKNPNFAQQPVDFFGSLLDKSKDINKGKTHPYSRIEGGIVTKSQIVSETQSYGFEFISYKTEVGIVPRVLYVIANSPAQKAGLKRGDYIYKINDNPVTTSNLGSLYGGEIKTLFVSQTTTSPLRKITLEEPQPIDNKPLYLYKTISNSGRNIAYVVYNHFTSGIGNDITKDRRYNDELCAMSNILAAESVNEMILDLRYNGGGQIDCAQLLATIIAPATVFNGDTGKIFCTIVDVNGKEQVYRFSRNTIRNGSNLNLQRLIVLTTEATASASELIINCLRPYMEVKIIGDVTEGKNVGSCDYKHEKFDHILKPLMCYVFNREGKADYNDGFSPDISYRDFNNHEKQYALGDTREAMFEIAIQVINNTYTSKITKAATINYSYKFTPIKSGIEIESDK